MENDDIFFSLIYKDIDNQMHLTIDRAIALRISLSSIFSLKVSLLNTFLELFF